VPKATHPDIESTSASVANGHAIASRLDVVGNMRCIIVVYTEESSDPDRPIGHRRRPERIFRPTARWASNPSKTRSGSHSGARMATEKFVCCKLTLH
jgi:hypothetical protein